MYKYETHLHTYPVSKCAKFGVRENLEFYKESGYDGIFITNHFLDGNINIEPDKTYEEKINFYCSDYAEAIKIADEIGIKVFFGIEISYKGTDFLIYGINKEWLLSNPQIAEMKKSEELRFFMENGALVIQAHPFRKASYIDHIRLFPECVHGVEVINASRNDFENNLAKQYAENYNLLEFAGSDNHVANGVKALAGMCSSEPILSEEDFVNAVKNGEMQIFYDNLT